MDRKDGLHTTITVPEIAGRMGICEETVYDMLRKHEIPNLRHGRRFIVSRTAFERWESTIGEGLTVQPEARPEPKRKAATAACIWRWRRERFIKPEPTSLIGSRHSWLHSSFFFLPLRYRRIELLSGVDHRRPIGMR
jgi:excisionase family DNA binding protein